MLLVSFPVMSSAQTSPDKIIAYTVDPSLDSVAFYWNDDHGVHLKSLGRLKTFVESKDRRLLFAMNAGMYMEDNSPLGLFIQDGVQRRKLNEKGGHGNFYLKPNGIFYINGQGQASVSETSNFKSTSDIKFATQSGPMLVIDGDIHPAFIQGSANLNIRNGVGILPDGKVIFAISTVAINFYDFAMFFKTRGCLNALYLDGFVSRAYFDDRDWKQLDGNFGVMIGVTSLNK
ncbi:hypothetical protein DQQ10_21875 [Pseudochryseolinea flava]|uniref:Phosphodiester glycosidase domain-containing protein n=2 Tax=Pseudochryseolinea flava TaxID=2059302 RepID=A0A364XXL9_9BACT|nr:hypothetical protein DQQ10_21875 [Pseudochryseolinea flava]